MTYKELYNEAKKLIDKRMISPFIEAGGVSAAIETDKGYVYYGVNIETAFAMGMCAERNAISNMITNGESKIKKVVAGMKDGSIGAPCGACREYLMQLDKDSPEMEILLQLNPLKTIKLKELIPDWWGKRKFEQSWKTHQLK